MFSSYLSELHCSLVNWQAFSLLTIWILLLYYKLMLGFWNKNPIFGQRVGLAFHFTYFFEFLHSCYSSRVAWTAEKKKTWKSIGKVFYLHFLLHSAFTLDSLYVSRHPVFGFLMGLLCQFFRALPTTPFPWLDRYIVLSSPKPLLLSQITVSKLLGFFISIINPLVSDIFSADRARIPFHLL